MPPTYTHEGAAPPSHLRRRAAGPGHPAALAGDRDPLRGALSSSMRERFGYLLKDRVIDVSILIHALNTIAAGGTVSTPRSRAPDDAPTRPHPSGTAAAERERAVLGRWRGRSNAAIADRLSRRSRPWRATSRTSSAARPAPEPDDHRLVRPRPPPSAWTDLRVRRDRRDEGPRGQQQARTRATRYASHSRLFRRASRIRRTSAGVPKAARHIRKTLPRWPPVMGAARRNRHSTDRQRQNPLHRSALRRRRSRASH